MRSFILFSLFSMALILTGCPSTGGEAPPVNEVDKAAWNYEEFMSLPEQPVENIEVQHVLIGVKAGLPAATRDEKEARAFALEIYKRAQDGEDFDSLVKEYTDDSHPGIYPMDQSSRKGMVPAFGDVGWRLKVGEIGMSDYDPATSKFGFHIIKRLK
ncbi:peptidylprolyl isomerase [Planctomycetota bacterium]|nr:peptidylprolyl isomerase [Planctomycetota bacterium]